MLIKELLNENTPVIGDILSIECGDTLIESTIIDFVEDGVVLNLDEAALKLIYQGRKKINEAYQYPPAGEPLDNFRDLLDFAKEDRKKYLAKALEKDLGTNDLNINSVAKRLHTPKSYSLPEKASERIARKLLLRVTTPDGKWKQDMGFRTPENPEGDDPETYNPQFWSMRPASLRDSINEALKPLTQAELELYNVEIQKLGKKIKMLNDLYMKYKDLKDSFKLSKIKERLASLSKEKTDLTAKLNDRISNISETGAPAPHRLHPEPDYRMDEAEYQGRKVSLGKPFLTPDGPKKRSVYVKNSKGRVVKVNFGQKGVKIKKSNPKRRKSFRARHNCATAKDRTTPRYWSCRFW